MSVFTHGVIQKGKPRPVNRNQVFTVLWRDDNPEKAADTYGNSSNNTVYRIHKGS